MNDEKTGRSSLGIYVQAGKLGLLGRECWTTLNQLVTETGYSQEALRKILKWAGVPVKSANTRRQKASRLVRTVVDRYEAHDAVERWCATENFRQAALSRGVTLPWLRRRLERAGIFAGTFGHRYDPADIDKAIADFESQGKEVLTRDQVRIIRASPLKPAVLAAQLGVGVTTVRQARCGATHKGVDAPTTPNGPAPALLSDDEVLAIRHATGTERAIADLFGVGRSTIHRIRRGQGYQHVGGPIQPPKRHSRPEPE